MALDKEDLGFFGILVLAIAAFFYYILGFSGMMSALGIVLLFFVPTFLIINNFRLEQDEKIVFSFFIGVGIFPSIAYWLGMLISFKIAIFATFAILLGIAFTIKKLRKK